MKNAFVLVHHYGDDGNAPEGAILRDITNTRFEALEKEGLVREATAEEVKAGYQPTIEPDPTPAAEEKQGEEPENKKAQEPANKAGAKEGAN